MAELVAGVWPSKAAVAAIWAFVALNAVAREWQGLANSCDKPTALVVQADGMSSVLSRPEAAQQLWKRQLGDIVDAFGPEEACSLAGLRRASNASEMVADVGAWRDVSFDELVENVTLGPYLKMMGDDKVREVLEHGDFFKPLFIVRAGKLVPPNTTRVETTEAKQHGMPQYWLNYLRTLPFEQLEHDVAFSVSTRDYYHGKPKYNGIRFSASRKAMTVPAISNWQHVHHLRGNWRNLKRPSDSDDSVGNWYKLIEEAAAAVPWADKSPIVVFRGSGVGGLPGKHKQAANSRETLHAQRMLEPRYKSAAKAEESRFFDSRMTAVRGNYKLEPERRFKLTPALPQPSSSIPESRYLSEYRHVLVIGGYGAAFRLSDHLCAGQTVLLQDFFATEWFAPLLTPMHDYVPVKSDLSDLEDRVAWLERNPLAARRIGEQGRRFFLRYLSAEATQAMVMATLARLGAEEARLGFDPEAFFQRVKAGEIKLHRGR